MSNAEQGEGFTHPLKNTGEQKLSELSIRYHYMDNLRALAMLVGVLFHASLAYSPMMQNLWMAASPDNSAYVDVIAWFSHTFRMPLFFLVSGFFALLLISKIGTVGFIKQRAKRILLPFVIFLPLVMVGIFSSIGWAVDALQYPSPMLQFIISMKDNPNPPDMPFSTMHLWFLFNLMQFCVVFAVIHKLGFFESKLVRLLTRPHTLVLLLPLLLVPALLSQHLPLPAPERIYPQLWSFGFFGIFFLFGGVLFRHQSTLQDLDKFQWLLLASSVTLYMVFYSYMPDQPLSLADIAIQMQPPELTLIQVIKAVLEAYIAWHMTLFCLLIGRNLLNGQNKVLAWISRSSYWVYIVHLPVLFYLQFLLLDIQLNMWLEFVISVIGTLIITIVSYQLLVAKTPIGTLLNGKKPSRPSSGD